MIRLVKAIWLVLALRCEEADRLRCAEAAESLAFHERLAGRVHESLCRTCREARRRLNLVDELVEESRTDDEAFAGSEARLEPAARERLERRLRDATNSTEI